MANNGLYGHPDNCYCIYCQALNEHYMSIAAQRQMNQLYGMQGMQQGLPPEFLAQYGNLGAQPAGPAAQQPGEVEHMKRAEPVTDEPVKQIEWKPRRLRWLFRLVGRSKN